jgi:tetratricopeptide (TPR) repeat protein
MFMRCVGVLRALWFGLAVGVAALPSLALADEYQEVQRLQSAGQTAEALARAEQYINAHPNDPQMRFIKAGVLSAAGRGAEALEMLTQLTRDYPELAEPWNNLAVLYAAQGQLDKAREALEMALRLNPDYAAARENLGDVLIRQAGLAWQRARQLDPASSARLTAKIDALNGLLGK